MRRYTLVFIAALLVLAGCLAVAPAKAHAAPLGARAAAAHTYSSDPLAGNNWYHDKMWFKVGYANYAGRYKMTWHNASGSHFSFYVARLSDNIYYEVKNHRCTYTFFGGYKVRAHYVNTKGRYINVTFMRVGG
ncbi:MAG TPA: hypothetical protein VFD50_09330 [Thermoleophilia bacterium]|nr:hypothetical protein [Thermoleophilia bacterium]